MQNSVQPFPLLFAMELPPQIERIPLILKSATDTFIQKYKSKTHYNSENFHKDLLNAHQQIKVYAEISEKIFKVFTKWEKVYKLINGVNKANQTLINFMDWQMINRRLYYNTPGNQYLDIASNQETQRSRFGKKFVNLSEQCQRCKRYCNQEKIKIQTHQLANYPFKDPYQYFQQGAFRRKIYIEESQQKNPNQCQIQCLDIDKINDKIFDLNQNSEHLEYEINDCLSQFQSFQEKLMNFSVIENQKYLNQKFHKRIQKQFRQFTHKLIIKIKQIWQKVYYKEKNNVYVQTDAQAKTNLNSKQLQKQKRNFQQQMRNIAKNKDKKIKQLNAQNNIKTNQIIKISDQLKKVSLQAKMASQEKQRLQKQLQEMTNQYNSVSNDLDSLKIGRKANFSKDSIWNQPAKNFRKVIRSDSKKRAEVLTVKSLKSFKQPQSQFLIEQEQYLKNTQIQQMEKNEEQAEGQQERQQLRQSSSTFTRSSKKHTSLVPKIGKKSAISKKSRLNMSNSLSGSFGWQDGNQSKSDLKGLQHTSSIISQAQSHEQQTFDFSKGKPLKRSTTNFSNFRESKQVGIMKSNRKSKNKKNLTAIISSKTDICESPKQKPQSPNDRYKNDNILQKNAIIQQQQEVRQSNEEVTCTKMQQQCIMLGNQLPLDKMEQQSSVDDNILQMTIKKFYNYMTEHDKNDQLNYQTFKTKFTKFLDSFHARNQIFEYKSIGTQTACVSRNLSNRNQRKNYSLKKAKLDMSKKFDFHYFQAQTQSKTKKDQTLRDKTNTAHTSINLPTVKQLASSTFHQYPRLIQKTQDFSRTQQINRKSQSQSPKKLNPKFVSQVGINLHKGPLFSNKDIKQVYLSVENAYQFQKSRKKRTNKRRPEYQQFLKSRELKLSNNILAVIAKLHISKPQVYNELKNFLIFPYGYEVHQQPTFKIVKSQEYYLLLRQSLNYLMLLHRNCVKSNPKMKAQLNGMCLHLVSFFQRIKQLI